LVPDDAQAIFGHLALGQNEAVNPRSFWRAFRDYDGSPINVREHQDAYEFFTRLQVCTCLLVHHNVRWCSPSGKQDAR
jgi:hypothetical protein